MMKALVLHDSPSTLARLAKALTGCGFQVLTAGSEQAARDWLDSVSIDVMIMDEIIAGQTSHPVALLAEDVNPFVSLILLSDRRGARAETLFLDIPALTHLVARNSDPVLISRLALASIVNVSQTADRVRQSAGNAMDPNQDIGENWRPAGDLASQIEAKIVASLAQRVPAMLVLGAYGQPMIDPNISGDGGRGPGRATNTDAPPKAPDRRGVAAAQKVDRSHACFAPLAPLMVV